MKSKHLQRLALVALAVGFVACKDSRVAALHTGITKDSVMKIISQGAPTGDSLPNVYRRVQYFVDSRFWDILLFDPKNRDASKDPLVADKELTPIIIVRDTLEGIGWSFADELSSKYHMQIRTLGAPRK